MSPYLDQIPRVPAGMSPSEPVILGTALAYPGRPLVALGDLEPDDLHSGQHAAILAAIRDLAAQGTPPEPPIVWAELGRQHGTRPTADRHWGVIVFDCLRMATVPEGCRPHRRAVLEARLRRDTYDQAEHLAYLSTGPLDEMHAALQATVTRLGRTLARIAEQADQHPTTQSPSLRAIHRAA